MHALKVPLSHTTNRSPSKQVATNDSKGKYTIIRNNIKETSRWEAFLELLTEKKMLASVSKSSSIPSKYA